MAANLKNRGIGSLSKRFVNQIWSGSSRNSSQLLPSSISPVIIRRGAHSSVYDKNIDDDVRPSVVPDEVIQPLSEKYWGPNPRTGVFGPASASENPEGPIIGGGGGSGSTESVLEQKAWFRPLEDVEKPQQN